MLFNHPIENIMTTTFANLKHLIDVDTVIGRPITMANNNIIIPISKVSMGFVVGGGEYGENISKIEAFPYAGGSGAGVSVSPIGFLIANGNSYDLIKVNNDNSEKWSELLKTALNTMTGIEKQ